MKKRGIFASDDEIRILTDVFYGGITLLSWHMNLSAQYVATFIMTIGERKKR
jgi:hypothetical protein